MSSKILYSTIEFVGFKEEFVEEIKSLLFNLSLNLTESILDDGQISYNLISENPVFPFNNVKMESNNMVNIHMNIHYVVGISALINNYINNLYKTFNKGANLTNTQKTSLIVMCQNSKKKHSKYDHALFLGFSYETISKLNEFYDGHLTQLNNNRIIIKDTSYFFGFIKAELVKNSNRELFIKVSDEKYSEVLALPEFMNRLKLPLKDVDNDVFATILDGIIQSGVPSDLIITDINLKPTETKTNTVSRSTEISLYRKEKVPFVLPKYDDWKDEVLENFINLTEYVVPNPQEKVVVNKMMKLLPNLQTDGYGNLFILIGETETLFTSHLDTVGRFMTKVTHTIKDGYIGTDGTTILGGDNKAGVTIMIHMINNNIPGLYYFFLGEECGCYGSKWLLNNQKAELSKYKRAIAFDRREKGSIITFQKSERTASDEFGLSLKLEMQKMGLDYHIDPNGSCTDTASFVDVIPECTNLSAGVYGEHTAQERLNIEYFLQVCNAVIGIDWEVLTTSRVPGTKERRTYTGVVTTTTRPSHKFNSLSLTDDEEEEDQEENDDDDYNYSIVNTNFKKISEIPTEYELLKIYNSCKTTSDKIGSLSVQQKQEAMDLWKESKDNYKRVDQYLNTKGFYSKDWFGLNTSLVYKYKESSLDIVMCIVPEDGLYLNSTRINSHSDMITAVETVLKKNKIKKKEIAQNFPVEFNEQEMRDGAFILDTKEGPLNTKDFVLSYGGNVDTFKLFTKLSQVNPNNVYYWPAWYKILLSFISINNLEGYKIPHLSKLVEEKWDILVSESKIEKSVAAYAMRDKKISSDFNQKWINQLKDLITDGTIIDMVAQYMANKKKSDNSTSSYKLFNSTFGVEIKVPNSEYVAVKFIINKLFDMDYKDTEVFQWVEEFVLKYSVLNQKRFPDENEIIKAFTIITDLKETLDFNKKRDSIISIIVETVRQELNKKSQMSIIEEA